MAFRRHARWHGSIAVLAVALLFWWCAGAAAATEKEESFIWANRGFRLHPDWDPATETWDRNRFYVGVKAHHELAKLTAIEYVAAMLETHVAPALGDGLSQLQVGAQCGCWCGKCPGPQSVANRHWTLVDPDAATLTG